eukprot:scaffold201_cov405-Prasinococcus_capsulatus_cf.AAC.41
MISLRVRSRQASIPSRTQYAVTAAGRASVNPNTRAKYVTKDVAGSDSLCRYLRHASGKATCAIPTTCCNEYHP